MFIFNVCLCFAVYVLVFEINLYNLLSLHDPRNRTGCKNSIDEGVLPVEIIKILPLIGNVKPENSTTVDNSTIGYSLIRTVGPSSGEMDPVVGIRSKIDQVLFGSSPDRVQSKLVNKTVEKGEDMLAFFPLGDVMRGELYDNKSAVHLPTLDLMYRGHCYLRLSWDYMQTAVDAFAILVKGNLDDAMRLPSPYVLKSARTIAMMRIERDKLVAMWSVVKGNRLASEVPYETLEFYRPLFKYLSGKEMARLNLSDTRILMYVGTHPGLNRHQVGVVASQYIRLNPYWREPMYLNMMNNLLCGIPINLMKNVPDSTYLQLSGQLFYHLRACDPLQRRYYLAMMSRSQILGKPTSWGPRDVSHLGLLLAEVDGPNLATINPDAFAGISAQLMVHMSPENLKYISERQMKYLKPKPYDILAKKLNHYGEQQRALNSAKRLPSIWSYFVIIFKIQVWQKCK